VLAATAVGVLLGWVALESGSILPGVLIHLVNNGAQVLLDRVPGLAGRLQSPLVLAIALASTAAGALLVRGSRRAPPEPASPAPVSLAAP
jgi:membrane protease YdiL (CAAX protease family)